MKNIFILATVTLIGASISYSLVPRVTEIQILERTQTIIEIIEVKPTARELIDEIFPDAPIMNQVAKCESGYRQFKEDGTVLISKTSDYGIFQINQINHPQALNLGIDIYTLVGNIMFARTLYDSPGGLGHWENSAYCWRKG